MDGGPVRVAVNAQFPPGIGFGGVESVVVALVKALGLLPDGDEEYVIVGPWQDPDWLAPYLGPNQRIVRGPAPADLPSNRLGRTRTKAVAAVKERTRRVPRVARQLDRRSAARRQACRPTVSVSDGFYEALDCNVIHFPYQEFIVSALPSVYNPHDLQHRHFPEFFGPETVMAREIVMRWGCETATTVVVASDWVKRDLSVQYGVSPERVQVIPWAAPTEMLPAPSDDLMRTVAARYGLDEPFVYYPAMVWAHKNHVRLLHALALLRDRHDLRPRLICTGEKRFESWEPVSGAIAELGLENQVSFLGMLPRDEMRAVYRLATCVVVPTLFEAASGPLFEAWLEGTPVACSTVTSLPEQAGSAALLFDPLSIEAIADAVKRLMSDDRLRACLAAAGRRRLADFSMERTARAYRAVYRRCAHQALNEEDEALLSWNWMANPERKATHD